MRRTGGRSRFDLAAAVLCSFVVVGPALASGDGDATRRGKYLVERVAMCQECHTPRDDAGALRRDQWLAGGAVFFRPAVPVAGWADRTPALAGLPGWSDADMTYFLQNGARRTGEVPRPPMKRYHLDARDAAAVVAYLRSLAAVPASPPHEPDDGVLPVPK